MSSFGLKFTALAVLPVALACGGVATDGAGQSGSGLTRAQSCEDLSQKLRADAIALVRQAADESRTTGYTHDGWVGVGDRGEEGNFGGGGNGGSGGSAGGGGSDPSPTTPPSGHSETNNQVAGVDEADIVKTDGERLWLLHGQELMVIDAWPPQSIGVERSLPIEGTPYEMFVADGRALVYSTVYLDVPSRDGSQGGSGSGWGTDGGVWDEGGYPGYPGSYGVPFTKLTVIDLDDRAPRTLRELYFEGNYTSSRRHGDQVRTVISGGISYTPPGYWDMPWGDPSSAHHQAAVDRWEANLIAALNARPLEDWLPRTFEGDAGDLTTLPPSCGDYYAPPPGETQPGLTRVVGLSLKDPKVVRESAVLGHANQVYSNADALVLAQTEYTASSIWGSSGERTALHLFGLAGRDSKYLASGSVTGHLDDQFSLDERGGVVRVATTSWGSSSSGESENYVFALRRDAGTLKVVGSTGPLAEGERIFSARFVGDKGYLVTFRQTDPLFVIDLSNPNDLKVLGELHIPGFSDYMHPLDAGHLVTIGRHRADDGWSEDALALQVFDVTNPTQPSLKHKHVFKRDGWSNASYDHKAFSFYADRELMAFPFSGYNERGMQASLEVFHVNAASGFRQLGSADHSDFRYGYGNEVRRGVFIDEFVYSISGGAILIHALSDMSQPIGTLPLPDTYGGGGYDPGPEPWESGERL
ncbi:MAG: beta-propeller domain-containing protein [Polyangiaceae bacterium]|nr:beta-propeller domain-containing protein [Polyangiaceae bacterium]MCW5791598.1 beta-propeller domain-containing protein [Polyangiaceae bacterium]